MSNSRSRGSDHECVCTTSCRAKKLAFLAVNTVFAPSLAQSYIAPIEPVYLRYKSSVLVVTALRLCGSTTVFPCVFFIIYTILKNPTFNLAIPFP